MRCSVWIVSLSLLLLARFPTQCSTFPIPAEMHETWPGAKLSETDTQLLRKAVESDLLALEQDCDRKTPFESVDSAEVNLGKLGKGVLVLMSGSCSCGSHSCMIKVYARQKDGYRAVGDSMGYAFAVVDNKAEVPDLVFASGEPGPSVLLMLYRFTGSSFVEQGCEILTSKYGTPSSWWDPSQVSIEPCRQH